MKQSATILIFMALLFSTGCDKNNDLDEPVPELLPTSGDNKSTGCGTASIRTLALEATRTLLPEKAMVTTQGNCVLAANKSHFTTFTSIYYSIEETSNLVCAIVDSFQNSANDVTAVTSLFYAEWYADGATSSAWSADCDGAFPNDATNTNELCRTAGFANPVTGTQAFKDLMSGEYKTTVFAGCTWAYATPFTE